MSEPVDEGFHVVEEASVAALVSEPVVNPGAFSPGAVEVVSEVLDCDDAPSEVPSCKGASLSSGSGLETGALAAALVTYSSPLPVVFCCHGQR